MCVFFYLYMRACVDACVSSVCNTLSDVKCSSNCRCTAPLQSRHASLTNVSSHCIEGGGGGRISREQAERQREKEMPKIAKRKKQKWGRDTKTYSNAFYFLIGPNMFFTITGIHTPEKTNSVALVNTISLLRIKKNIFKEVGVKH